MKKTLYVFVWACCALLALPAAAQVPGYVPTDGLVGWWPFNGNANDESGNGNDGVVNGATLTEDRFGLSNSCYLFDGSDDRIVIQQSLISASPSSYTISVWFKSNLVALAQDNNPHVISDRGPTWGYKYAIARNVGGQHISGSIYSGGCCTTDGVIHNIPNEDLDWHQAILTYDHDSSIINFFIDGELSGSTSNVTQWSDVTSGTTIGALNSPGNWYWGHWNGLIDDVAIFNRALNPEEVQELYTGQPVAPPVTCSPLPSNLQQGLVGYWPFCGNANDESGNGNDGTVNGATLTEDRFGNAESAYELTEYSNNIIFTNNPQFDFSEANDLTLSYWLKRTSGNIFSLYKYDNGYADNSDFAISAGPETSLNLIGNGTNSIPFEVNGEEWEQVTAIFSRDSNQTKLYVNGLLVLQGTINYNQSSSSSPFAVNFAAGIQNYTTGLGKIDDIAIYNRALTPDEVQDLYTLDACTFTVYDTLTVENIVNVYDTINIENVVNVYDTLFTNVENIINVYDTTYTNIENVIDVYDTTFTTIENIVEVYDTVTIENVIDIYDTTYVTVTDTLLIDITFTGFEGQPSWLNTVTVFPNPASDHITIDYGNFALMAGYNTIITDAAGATVYSSAVNSQQVEIDINAWGAMGVYYMMIYDLNGALVAVRQIVLE